MEDIKASDVDQLYGLTLSIAYAIFVEGWKWFNFPGTKTPNLLLDAPLPDDKIPDKNCARYIGDDYYVFKDLPRYHENLTKMFNHGTKLVEAGYQWGYSRYIEEELGSSNHIDILHCNAEIRCRAILKFYLDNPCLRGKMLAF